MWEKLIEFVDEWKSMDEVNAEIDFFAIKIG